MLAQIMPWSKVWSLIEYPILFMPRWLIFAPLLLLVFSPKSSFSLVLKQKYAVTLSLLLAFFIYLGFSLPVGKIFNDQNSNLRVMSLNLGGKIRNEPKLNTLLKYGKADIIALQETPEKVAKKIIPSGWSLHCSGQMCLASAYPISFIDNKERKFLGGWGSFGVLYQVNINGQVVRVINTHLETPRKGFEDFQLSKLNFSAVFNNSQQRFLEANLVADWALNQGVSLILGDFNMPADSSIYRAAFASFDNAFDSTGTGLGYTKFTRYHGVRIDHLLVDPNTISVNNSWVSDDVGSDHRAVFADLLVR
ncbi:endonuclease/exonuclease/phosphatase family protein [Thalassotalea sp. PLHSN55]|uniref:endonuclease/exonuclease/phosphatase family protein n=1 Tax=Thalassotalea sp. PLHSN55 TaxID=3435888 RepID=UPI003F87E805